MYILHVGVFCHFGWFASQQAAAGWPLHTATSCLPLACHQRGLGGTLHCPDPCDSTLQCLAGHELARTPQLAETFPRSTTRERSRRSAPSWTARLCSSVCNCPWSPAPVTSFGHQLSVATFSSPPLGHHPSATARDRRSGATEPERESSVTTRPSRHLFAAALSQSSSSSPHTRHLVSTQGP